MGEPAIPTEAEREATRRRAYEIVDGVRYDKAVELPADEDELALLVFELAQEIELLTRPSNTG